MKNLQKFTNNEFGEIRVLNFDGEIWFVGKDVSETLGYKQTSNMKKLIDKEDLREINPQSIENAGFIQNGVTLEPNKNIKRMLLINESGLYTAIFGSKLESAKAFKKWVTKEVLPTIRKSGVYITEDATEEAIDYQKLYGSRRIRKTFTNTDDYQKEWNRFLELSKEEAKKRRIDNKDRINAANIILDVLRTKIDTDILSLKGSQVIAIQELISEIQTQVIEWGNRRYGAKLGHANKQLKEAKELESDFRAYFEQEELGWTEEIPVAYHPFSENCMYRAIDENKMVKTDVYKRWIKEFPYCDIPSKEEFEEAGINFKEPVDIRVGFRALEKFDKQNFLKPFLDVVFNYLQVDDRMVSDLAMIDLGVCDEYCEGGFVFQVRNKVLN